TDFQSNKQLLFFSFHNAQRVLYRKNLYALEFFIISIIHNQTTELIKTDIYHNISFRRYLIWIFFIVIFIFTKSK
ncbi:hypothetical protein RAYM_09769, partial [Riemerella anatipestifer RA-YM]